MLRMKIFKGTEIHSVPNKVDKNRQSRINNVENVTDEIYRKRLYSAKQKDTGTEEDLLKCGMGVLRSEKVDCL
jgi:hypothetical protein